MTHAEALALARKKKRAAEAKGRRLQLMARDYFIAAYAAKVCVAWKMVHWIPAPNGKRFPLQVRHDFYGLWDLIVSYPNGVRAFVQVTTIKPTNNVAAKRTAILADGFPVTDHDMILGHEGGRRFRVLRGPAFKTGSETLEAPKRARGGPRGRPKTIRPGNADALTGPRVAQDRRCDVRIGGAGHER